MNTKTVLGAALLVLGLAGCEQPQQTTQEALIVEEPAMEAVPVETATEDQSGTAAGMPVEESAAAEGMEEAAAMETEAEGTATEEQPPID